MIKANEIRLGNWLFDPDGKEKQVDYSDLVSLSITTLHFNPIHLTREMLERCGFKADLPDFANWIILEMPIANLVFDGKEIFIDDAGDSLPFPHIKYVHQLQNLYYALTGEELEFKEPVNQ